MLGEGNLSNLFIIIIGKLGIPAVSSTGNNGLTDSGSELVVDEADSLCASCIAERKNSLLVSEVVSEAIAKELINPEVKSWRFMEEEAPLVELMNAGALTDKTALQVSPDIKVSVSALYVTSCEFLSVYHLVLDFVIRHLM